MRLPFFKPKRFEPSFPIIPLYATKEEAHSVMQQFADVVVEEPESDKAIAQRLITATRDDTRISAGLWDGRVRFTNYRTEDFNQNDDLKGRKLGWFIDYYGGTAEFDEPQDTGHMVFWRNPVRKLLIVFGLHMGPVRIIDKDPDHWARDDEQK